MFYCVYCLFESVINISTCIYQDLYVEIKTRSKTNLCGTSLLPPKVWHCYLCRPFSPCAINSESSERKLNYVCRNKINYLLQQTGLSEESGWKGGTLKLCSASHCSILQEFPRVETVQLLVACSGFFCIFVCCFGQCFLCCCERLVLSLSLLISPSDSSFWITGCLLAVPWDELALRTPVFCLVSSKVSCVFFQYLSHCFMFSCPLLILLVWFVSFLVFYEPLNITFSQFL